VPTEQLSRQRKRSKRRQIMCPLHYCYLDSVSQKYPLFADRVEHLCQAGFSPGIASTIVQHHTTVPLAGEWLEKFWCEDCQSHTWYRVKRLDPRSSHTAAAYELSPVVAELWQRVSGILHPDGNQSVSEFTRKQAKATVMSKDFSFVRQ
jgi:hypothetical protein